MPTITSQLAQFALARLFQTAQNSGPFASWEELAREAFQSSRELHPLTPETVAAIGGMTVEELALLACQEGRVYR